MGRYNRYMESCIAVEREVPGTLDVDAISGSGNSENVVNAAEYAKESGCKVIGLTGYDGGKLKRLSDVSLHVPVRSMQITEDIHMIFNYLMMSVFCKAMCGTDYAEG